jgi:hypothetical protein
MPVVGLFSIMNKRDERKCSSTEVCLYAVQVRYQGVDWRDKSNWGCNAEFNPHHPHHMDGGSIEAMEVMFVKVKERFLDHKWPFAVNAQLYDHWYRATAQVRLLCISRCYPPLCDFLLLVYPHLLDWPMEVTVCVACGGRCGSGNLELA